MKKFLLILFLVAGSFFVSADGKNKKNWNRKAFIKISTGSTFFRDARIRNLDSRIISLGKTIKNSQGTYLGALSLGINDGNIDVNYSYSFLKKRGWSLGAEGSVLIGFPLGVPFPEEPLPEELDIPLYLGAGGRFGLYTQMKVSRSFGVGADAGLQTIKGLRNFSNFSASNDIFGYFHVGLSYHFK